MKNCSAILCIAVVCLLGCSSQEQKQSKMDASIPCILFECTRPFFACVTDKGCRSKLNCTKECDKIADPEQRQLCLTECTAVNPNRKFLDLAASMAKNGCITPPEYDCPLPRNRSQLAPLTLAQLEGDWWVIRGLSRAYDCFSCQKMTFHRISETVSTYDYTYIPGKSGNVIDAIKCTITAIPYSPAETAVCPGRFRINYNAYGMEGADNVFVLSHPRPDYLLLYYCGQTPSDKYRGSIVISRSPETRIPAEIEKELNRALANAGLPTTLSLNDYRVPDNSACIGKN